jgi:hypothetical protein
VQGLNELLSLANTKQWYPLRSNSGQYQLNKEDVCLVEAFGRYLGLTENKNFNVSPISGVAMFAHWRTVGILLSNAGLEKVKLKRNIEKYRAHKQKFLEASHMLPEQMEIEAALNEQLDIAEDLNVSPHLGRSTSV